MQKLPENRRTFAGFESQLRTDPNLSGVCLHISWDQIETVSGKPDFRSVDKVIAIFRSVGMKYQLCLKSGDYTPEFVYTDGAKAFATRVQNPHRADVGQEVKIPVPWDPAYNCKNIRSPSLFKTVSLSGRKQDTRTMSYDLVQKYGDRVHHGFRSLGALSQPNERMGSMEMAALNVVHASGEYWELWHGDGFNRETSSAVAKVWQQAKEMGYDAYKKK